MMPHRQPPMRFLSTSNANQFRSLAVQHCSGMIAQIARAEQCNPGSTGEALMHARAALEALQRGNRPLLPLRSESERDDVRRRQSPDQETNP